MKSFIYGFLGIFTFFVIVGILDKYQYLDPLLDYFGLPK